MSVVRETWPDQPPVSVGYVLHRFPYRTETFITREMSWLVSRGHDLKIFSLLKPQHKVKSKLVRELEGSVIRPIPKLKALLAVSRLVARQPVSVATALARQIRLTYREPMVLARAILLFPRSLSIATQVKDLGIGHIHANFVWLEALAATTISELTGVPFTVQPHAFGLFGRNQHNVARQLEAADGIVTISEYNAKHIRRLSEHLAQADVEVIHCGVDPRLFRPDTKADREQVPVILSVGRAIPKKGHRFLIEACALLQQRGIAFRCEIVTGGGELETALRQQISRLGLSDVVTLSPPMDEESMSETFRRADVFALACVVADSGDRDGIPVAVMEAMATGLPVVVGDVSGVGELVDHENSGYLVDGDDPGQLADALGVLVADGDLRRRMGASGRQTVLQSFDSKTEADRMAQYFASIQSKSVHIPLLDETRP